MYTLIYSCFISNTEINAGFFVGFRAENPWKGKYNMIRARIFRPARAGAEFLKLSASPFYFIGPRRSQRRGRLRPRARAPSPFVASRHFPRPAGESSPNPCRPPAPRGNLPQTPAGPSFSCWKKRKQKTIQGDYCPLENPLLGSALAAPHAGRPLLSLRDISPALRGNRPLPHGRIPWWWE